MPKLKITVPGNYQRWMVGLKHLGPELVGQSQLWAAANDIFFDATQRYVHVITGDLKASGRNTLKVTGFNVIGTVEYGNDTVKYAQAEIDRGGEHDYMGRGWEASQPIFQAALGDAWLKVTAKWK